MPMLPLSQVWPASSHFMASYSPSSSKSAILSCELHGEQKLTVVKGHTIDTSAIHTVGAVFDYAQLGEQSAFEIIYGATPVDYLCKCVSDLHVLVGKRMSNNDCGDSTHSVNANEVMKRSHVK